MLFIHVLSTIQIRVLLDDNKNIKSYFYHKTFVDDEKASHLANIC